MNEHNQKYIAIMQDIYDVSAELGLKSFVWGGFAVDILHGAFTREHSDLDCFTENLVENLDALTKKYKSLGYVVNYYEELWMLEIRKGDIHAAFNTVKNIDGIAHWHHAGAHGTLFFPYEWLDDKPRNFYGTQVYTCGIEVAYIIRMVHAEWSSRDKDKADIEILTQLVKSLMDR